MKKVEFIKKFAGFAKGKKHSFESQHAFYLVNNEKVAKFVTEQEDDQ